MVSGLTPFVIIGIHQSLIKYVLLHLHDAPIRRGAVAIYPVNAANFTYMGDLETISFKYLTSLVSISE